MKMSNEKRKGKFRIRIIIVILVVLLLGIKSPNLVYGIFNPPQRIEDLYISEFYDDACYDNVIIEYWDKSKKVMFFKCIDDIDVVNEILNLSGDIELRQTLWDDNPIWYSRQLRLIDNGFLRIKFINSNNNESWMYYIVDNKYYCSSSMMMTEFNSHKHPINKAQIFDYLNQFADEYDEKIVAQHIP